MIECKNIDCKEDPLLKSIKLNYVFYSILLACLFIISHYTNSSFFWCIITFMYVSFSGYFTHYLSHTINLTEMYKIETKSKGGPKNTKQKTNIVKNNFLFQSKR